MSKVSFRARTLDANKPLPVYTEDELPDLAEYVANNRTVPQMPTGMEKEEESERHLQRVINARQNFSESGKAIVIPIPEAAIPVQHYSSVYKTSFNSPLYYIRVPGLGLREDIPDYDLDSEDEEWLNAQSQERPLSPLHFERMMDKLEKGSGNTVLSEHDAQVLLKDEQDLVMAVYDYWLAKRLRLGRSLIPAVRNDRRDGTTSSNPYLAFRKRTEKMQTRKNRKNDEQAYTHMLKLKRDLSKAMKLIELVRDREVKKNELDKCYAEIFKKRYQLEDWSGSLLSTLRPSLATPTSGGRHLLVADGHWDNKGISLKMDGLDDNRTLVGTKRKKKKKLFSPVITDSESPLTPSSLHHTNNDKLQRDNVKYFDERTELPEPDGPFTFKRKVHVHYHPNYDWTTVKQPEEGPLPKRYCYSKASMNGRQSCHFRRRVGRGGRTIWDRRQDSTETNTLLVNGDTNSPHALSSSYIDESNVNDSSIISGGSTNRQQMIEEDDIEEDQETPNKCICYYPISPPHGSTNFTFLYLPFIDPSTYYCPDINKGYNKFRGLQSDTETQDEVFSFSSLPTSLFALKPSIDLSTSRNNNNRLNSSSEIDKNETREEGTSSGGRGEIVGKLPVPTPPTHLSLVDAGLPVQIHVGSLKHLPKKETVPSTSESPLPSTATSSNIAPSLPPSSLPIKSDTGSSSKATIANQSKVPSTVTVSERVTLDWQASQPSSSLSGLDKCPPSSVTKRQSISVPQRRRHGRNNFTTKLSSQIVTSITNQLKVSMLKKSESTSLPPSQPHSTNPPLLNTATSIAAATTISSNNTPPSLSLSNTSINRMASSLPSSTSTAIASTPSVAAVMNTIKSPSLLTQQQTTTMATNKLVNSLILDPRTVETVLREKAALAVPPPHPVSAIVHHSNSNSSPNGGTLHDLFASGKLQAETEKEIKHAMAAGTVVNHNSTLVDGTAANSLVKLSTPSQVT